MQTSTGFIIIALLLGAMMSVYLPMNSSVSRHLGSAMAATITFFSIALVTSILIFIFWGEHAAMTRLRSVPGYLYLSGFLSAFMIIGTTFLIPQLGARKFFILLISGQVMMAIVVSHFGLLESPRDAITIPKLFGAGLVIAGIYLSTARKRKIGSLYPPGLKRPAPILLGPVPIMINKEMTHPRWRCYCRSAGLVLVLAVALLFSCSASNPNGTTSPVAEVSNAGWRELKLHYNDLERWFRVYQPPQLAAGCPVVVLLHGGTQSMRKIFRPRSGGTQEWRQVADKEKFLLLVPNGTNPETGDTFGNKQNWNDVRNSARVNNPVVDDVGFVRELFKWSRTHYPVDPQRFYVTGASNGGMMTYRLLMEMSGQIAAGAAFIANLPVDEQRLRVPQRAVPLLICNGTADPLVRWEGGEIPGGRGNVRSAEQTAAWWVRANRADRNAISEKLPDNDTEDGCRLTRNTYPPLPGGAVVEFVRMQGGGHTLPSYKHPLPDRLWIKWLFGPVCRDTEGAWLAWNFLRQHRINDLKTAP